jgi:hypothetical protein
MHNFCLLKRNTMALHSDFLCARRIATGIAVGTADVFAGTGVGYVDGFDDGEGAGATGCGESVEAATTAKLLAANAATRAHVANTIRRTLRRSA